MPSETFFNLPEDKRQAIYQAALDEFAIHPFKQASVNRIVARCGIAKGSFYQYFKDKQDLFLYILQVIHIEKMKYLAPTLQNMDSLDFFTALRELYRAGIQFALDHPAYAKISKHFLSSKGTPFYKEVISQSMPAAFEFFEPWLKKAIQKGELRSDLDVHMIAYLITSLNTLVVEYYLEYISSEYQERMIETVDKFLDFLKQGIGVQTVQPSRTESTH